MKIFILFSNFYCKTKKVYIIKQLFSKPVSSAMAILRDTYNVERLKDCEAIIFLMKKVNDLINAMMIRNSINGVLNLEEGNKHREVQTYY